MLDILTIMLSLAIMGSVGFTLCHWNVRWH